MAISIQLLVVVAWPVTPALTCAQTGQSVAELFAVEPPSDVRQATLEGIKQPAAQEPYDPSGPPTFRYHNVPEGTADVLAKIIPQIALNPSVRCAPSGSKKLFMYADPTTHSMVQAVIGTMYFVQIVADECRPFMPRVR